MRRIAGFRYAWEMFVDDASSLDGRVAVVTGAGASSDGWSCGSAIAVALARRGAHVVVLDVSEQAAAETKSIIDSEGNLSSTSRCDVTDEKSVVEAVEGLRASFGHVDILVNNVGISAIGTIERTDLVAWNLVLTVNLTSMMLTCKHIIGMLSRPGGSIINISSMAALGWTGIPLPAYASSKAGVLQLTKQIALECAPVGIRANAVVVGMIDTPMMRRGFSELLSGAEFDKAMQDRDARVPLGKMGTAWDIAHTVTFLAGDGARFITGADIVVDGGASCRVA